MATQESHDFSVGSVVRVNDKTVRVDAMKKVRTCAETLDWWVTGTIVTCEDGPYAWPGLQTSFMANQVLEVVA